MTKVKEELMSLQSINCAGLVLTGQLNSNAELAKKSVDVFADGLKSTGEHIHRIKTHLPVISLVLKLTSFSLQIAAILLDKNKPVSSKLFATTLMGFMMAGCIAVFFLAASNPITAIGIGLGMVGVGFLLESVGFVRSWIKYRQSKKKLEQTALTPIEVIECNNLVLQKKGLEEKLDKLVYRLHSLNLSKATTNHEKDCAIKAIKQCQEELHLVTKKLKFYSNKEAAIKKSVSEQKKSYQHARLGLFISLGSSLTAVAGLLLAPSLPIVGFFVIALGISFDLAGFYRHFKAKKRGYNKQKNERINKAIGHNMQVFNSVERIKGNNRGYARTYVNVISQLGQKENTLNKGNRACNSNSFSNTSMPLYRLKKCRKPEISGSKEPMNQNLRLR